MSVATLAAPVAAARSVRAAEIDNRAAYAGFGLAYVLGHGAAAVSYGPDPLLPLPGWLPTTLLVGGLVAGTAGAIVASTRAQRGAAPDDVTSGRLLGAAWATAFVALFLAITGLTTAAATSPRRATHPASSTSSTTPRSPSPTGRATAGPTVSTTSCRTRTSACSTWARAPRGATCCTTPSARGCP